MRSIPWCAILFNYLSWSLLFLCLYKWIGDISIIPQLFDIGGFNPHWAGVSANLTLFRTISEILIFMVTWGKKNVVWCYLSLIDSLGLVMLMYYSSLTNLQARWFCLPLAKEACTNTDDGLCKSKPLVRLFLFNRFNRCWISIYLKSYF